MIKEQWFIKHNHCTTSKFDALSKEITFIHPSAKNSSHILSNWKTGIFHDRFHGESQFLRFAGKLKMTLSDWYSTLYQRAEYLGSKWHKHDIRKKITFDTRFSFGHHCYIVTDYLTGGDLANYFNWHDGNWYDIMRHGFRMIMLSLYRTGSCRSAVIYTEWLMTSTTKK